MKLPEDPIILELLPDFIESWTKDVESKLEDIVHSKNEHELFRFGHTLKGSSRQFGVDHIAHYGTALQDFSKNQDWNAALQLKSEILNSLQEVKLYLVCQGLLPTQNQRDIPSNL